MYLYFSTIFRYAPIDEQAGELVKLNWENKQIKFRVPIEYKTLMFEDPNPRGNSRGGRGVAVIGDKVIVAGYCELQIYDRDLNFLYPITHNLMAGIHEVFHESGDRLWITSTTLNTALLIDIQTGEVLEQIWPQEIETFQKRWNLKTQNIDKTSDNRIKYLADDIFKNKRHLHFNAIFKWQGVLYGLFNRFGAIVNLSDNKIVAEDPAIKGAHNLYINSDGIIFVNDTRNQGINLYTMDGNLVKRINLLPYHKISRKVPWYRATKPVRKLFSQIGLSKQEVVTPFHVRGLDICNKLLFCGISPATILCVNWHTGELVDTFDYTDDVRIAIHGLKLDEG